MFTLTAFLVGFLGSFHCIGMCGPIAMALPLDKTSSSAMLTGRLLYNSGRIITYSILGLAFGMIGHTIAMAGFQKNLSIAAGILILVVAVISLAWTKINSFSFILAGYTTGLKNTFRKLFGQRSRTTLFLIGIVNGLLPCGFVYLALAGAAASGNFFDGMAYMLFFGFGTLPVMLSLSVAGNILGFRFRKYISKATPFVAAALAVFLIMRGINMQDGSCCHHH
ncbi:MAG: sulfite exporter TauE/SafE family protein [Bacteroidetes bacterium]|nr:sulfite exporter TauE/SafE family protein [Bacteroidota bacterium]